MSVLTIIIFVSVRKVIKHKLTTESVPMRTCGGDWFEATISAMKLAVIPMMAMREITCMMRTTVNVAPRAPNFGPGMMKD